MVRTVKWAGEPVKGVDEKKHLHPRASFASWKETVHGQSIAWSPAEIESAQEFRAALATIGLRRAEEEAELSAARFNKLTHTLPIKIFAVTDDGNLSYVNGRWETEGLSAEGLWYAPGRLTRDDSERCAAAWKHAVETETEFEEEVRFIRPSPKGGPALKLWNLVHLVPFRRKGATRAGWIGASIDLTERKQRELALRLTDKLAQTSRMTSFFAHEINNPLEAITNLLYLLRPHLTTASGAAEYLGQIESELERISGTVKQTFRWSNENSDKEAWTTVGDVFEDAVRLFSAKIRNRELRVTISSGGDIPIFGIVAQLRQVAAHLLSNAIDAVPVAGAIELREERAQETVELLVIDDGTGISPVDENFLFEPFFSTKGDLGNGLGLYISREIIDRHEGRIEIKTSPGKGTTVRVSLPSSRSSRV